MGIVQGGGDLKFMSPLLNFKKTTHRREQHMKENRQRFFLASTISQKKSVKIRMIVCE